MYSGFSGNCSHNFALIRILMVYHGLNISVMKSHAARSVNSVSSVNALCVYICDLHAWMGPFRFLSGVYVSLFIEPILT